MFEMSMSCEPRHEARAQLSHECKQELKQLLKLKLELRSPEIPMPTKGLEGLRVANAMLKERKAIGLLIGGLSEKVWNLRRKAEQLLEHKDVDVMVVSDDFHLSEKFEGGIDWFLPQSGKVTIASESGRYEIDKKWWTNGNGTLLSFGLDGDDEVLEPGLYIPDDDWVVEMRVAETLANTERRVMPDWNVIDCFKERIRKRIGTRLPRFIRDEFKGQILSYTYENEDNMVESLPLEEFILDDLRAINRFRSAEDVES